MRGVEAKSGSSYARSSGTIACRQKNSEAIMSQTATELLDAAMALPDEHRLELAEALLASIDPSLRPPLDESWREVIRRRSDELKSGKLRAFRGTKFDAAAGARA